MQTVINGHQQPTWVNNLHTPCLILVMLVRLLLAKNGIEHGPASKVMSRLHEHSVLTVHQILKPARVLEREETDKSRQNRQDPQ